MSAIDKLKQPPPPMMVPACTTCRHRFDADYPWKHNPQHWHCGAHGGRRTADVFPTICQGNLWEPVPPRPGLLTRLLRWLI